MIKDNARFLNTGNNGRDFDYEIDELNDSDEIKRYQITAYSVDRSVSTLIKWKTKKKLIVPVFQRKFVWNFYYSCRFIDTILLGLPSPNIFVFKQIEGNEEKYILVDGMQRMSAIEQFYLGKWKQNGEEKLFKINLTKSSWFSKTYENLDQEDKDMFDDYNIVMTVFETTSMGNSNRAIYSLFERINTGSEKLSEQEIRNAVYQGACLDYLKSSLDESCFRHLINKDKRTSKRGKDLELLLRIFGYYCIYRRALAQLDDIIDDKTYNSESTKISTSKIHMLNLVLDLSNNSKIDYVEYIKDVCKSLDVISQNFGEYSFYSKKRNKNEHGSKVHELFMEALVIAIIENSYQVNISIEEFVKRKFCLWNSDKFYNYFIQKSTLPENVVNRVKEIQLLISEDIYD